MGAGCFFRDQLSLSANFVVCTRAYAFICLSGWYFIHGCYRNGSFKYQNRRRLLFNLLVDGKEQQRQQCSASSISCVHVQMKACQAIQSTGARIIARCTHVLYKCLKFQYVSQPPGIMQSVPESAETLLHLLSPRNVLSLVCLECVFVCVCVWVKLSEKWYCWDTYLNCNKSLLNMTLIADRPAEALWTIVGNIALGSMWWNKFCNC